jgi:hypothetical protein
LHTCRTTDSASLVVKAGVARGRISLRPNAYGRSLCCCGPERRRHRLHVADEDQAAERELLPQVGHADRAADHRGTARLDVRAIDEAHEDVVVAGGRTSARSIALAWKPRLSSRRSSTPRTAPREDPAPVSRPASWRHRPRLLLVERALLKASAALLAAAAAMLSRRDPMPGRPQATRRRYGTTILAPCGRDVAAHATANHARSIVRSFARSPVMARHGAHITGARFDDHPHRAGNRESGTAHRPSV